MMVARTCQAFVTISALALVCMLVAAKENFLREPPVAAEIEPAWESDAVEIEFRNDQSTGNERLDQIKTLVDSSIRAVSRKAIKAGSGRKWESYINEAADSLAEQPDLIPPFIEFFVMRTRDVSYLVRGLQILRRVGRDRLYDTARLMEIIKSLKSGILIVQPAIECITAMSDKIDERILVDLLEDKKLSRIRRTVIECNLAALADLTDRKKAGRILRKCLGATGDCEHHEIYNLIKYFEKSIEKNEDIFAAMLKEPLQPHETVIVAAALRGHGPVDCDCDQIAEDACWKSPLARAIFFHAFEDPTPAWIRRNKAV